MDVGLPRDFKEFLASLSSHNVEFLLIGGYAVGCHGYPRATTYIDVWIRVSDENADRVVAALKDFGFGVPTLRRELFLVPGNIVRLGSPPLRIEIATSISGVGFDECYSRSARAELDGVFICVISREDLLENKRAAGKPKDLADLHYLTRSTSRLRKK